VKQEVTVPVASRCPGPPTLSNSEMGSTLPATVFFTGHEKGHQDLSKPLAHGSLGQAVEKRAKLARPRFHPHAIQKSTNQVSPIQRIKMASGRIGLKIN